MSFDELASDHGEFYSPRFEIALEDRSLREADGAVSDLSVDLTRNGADRFSFGLTYPFDHENATFPDLDWDAFATGTEVEISVGYADSRRPVLVGTISSLQPQFPSGGAPTVSVSGYGLLHEMMQGKHSDSWRETSVSDVVRELADEYFSEVTVDETGLTPSLLVQDKQSDYRFVEELANKYGFEILASCDEFEFRARDSRRSMGDPVVTLRYGESLGSFSPEVNDAEQVEEVVVRHWDDQQKEAIVGTARSEGEGTGKEALRIPVDSQEDAEEHAEAELERISESYVTGSAETVGLPEIVVGESVRVEGLPDRFTANYYVTSATHRIGGSGYQTSVDVTEKKP